MKHLDLTYLLENVTSDQDFINELLGVFLNSLSPDTKALEDAIDAKEHERISRAAHKVKSSFRSLGMMYMTNLLQDIETTAKDHQELRVIEEKHRDFQNAMPDVLLEIEDYLAAHVAH